MLSYIIRRILLMIPTMIGITLMLFLMARFAPGLTGGQAFGEGGQQQSKTDRQIAVRNLEKKLNMLDQNGNPIPIYKQYFIWLYNACHFEFGESVKYNVKVSSLIVDTLPVTLTMNVIETFVVYVIAVPFGMLAALRRGKYFDVAWGLLSIALFSIPVIWSGNMAIFLFANPQHMAWFPPGLLHSVDTHHMTAWQYSMDYLWHLVLPVIVMTLGGFAFLTKMMRASLLDNLDMDYVRTARAKGVGRVKMITHHVMRNSLLPMITIFSGVIPGLLGGSMIIERIFSIPGMGQLAYTATLSRDLPVLQAITFIGSIISLFCILLQDLCYAVADPRVTYD